VRGEVVSLDCGRGEILIEAQLGVRLRVAVSPETTIRQGNDDGLSCADARIGGALRVRGGLIDSPELLLPVVLADDVLLLGGPP
jgi:hypothetical protein